MSKPSRFKPGELDLPFSNAKATAKLSHSVNFTEWVREATRPVRLRLLKATRHLFAQSNEYFLGFNIVEEMGSTSAG